MAEKEETEVTGKGAYGTVHFTEDAMKAEGMGVHSIDRRALQSLVDRGKAASLEEAAKLVDRRMAEIKEDSEIQVAAPKPKGKKASAPAGGRG